MTVAQAFDFALGHFRAGRMADAESVCRQILAAQPSHPDTLYLLGLIALQARRHDLAEEWVRKAIEANPAGVHYYLELGNILAAQGRLEEAIATYRSALRLKPDFPEALNNLGNILRAHGQMDEAIVACRRALQLRPDFPEALNNLGNALRDRGQFDEAMAEYRRALRIKPDLPQVHTNLGLAFSAQEQLPEAIAEYREALRIQPNFPEALNNLANAFKEQGRLDEAIAAYRQALGVMPNSPEIHSNLGHALRERGFYDEAIAACRRALECNERYPDAHNNLGNALGDRGRLDEAIAEYRRALQIKSDFADAMASLGNALKDRGELDEAIAEFRRALQIKPGCARWHSALIHTLHFHPDHDAASTSEERRRWDERFGAPPGGFILPHPNDRSAGRCLRIAYVSPDFRDHPVGRYLKPLLENHDRERFEIVCYSGVLRPDQMTERLRALAGEWRHTTGVSDVRLAEMIREDRVDILVNLTMHTAGNRLPMFARRPSPVQVTWLAYPGSTGLRSIDYRITDAYMDPLEEEPRWSTEKPVRLPDGWCCYQSPEVNALPASAARKVTFGSLNNFAKVNERVLALWAQILEAAKGSRLLMLCPEGQARERTRMFFGARGIGADRIEFTGFLSRFDYLSLYQRIDIALDPFPCNGMTTTCDALWMGVPVLTLPGSMPASRAGLSLLSTIGLSELSAKSEADYVRMAVDLAGDFPRLEKLRTTLRPRMQASPLMDAPGFARKVEDAYRAMWEHWLTSSPGP